MAQRVRCPVCQSTSVSTFLNREGVPMIQNLLMKDQSAAMQVPRGNLSMVVCKECGFVFNQAFETSDSMYGDSYDNTQTSSPLFVTYVDGLASDLVSNKGVRHCRIVEVGCGKGLFLRRLVEAPDSGNTGHGFDPSYVGPMVDAGGRLTFEKRYYDGQCTDVAADVVVSRHVIEHVPDPVDMLRTVRQALANSSHAKVFFETPCVEWILTNRVIWDFFYEHCSYFGAASLTTAFETAGFEVQSIRNVFTGQYLWAEATVSGKKSAVCRRPGPVPDLAIQFATSERRLKEALVSRIGELGRKGNVALWGAGAKGVTFANLADPKRECIACVVDLNPRKQGKYIPGTGHPIVGYRELPRFGVRSAILMNPNYRQENLGFLRDSGLDVELIDLMDPGRGEI